MAGEGFQLRLIRTKVGNVDDDDPNAVAPPAGELLRLASYRENPNRPVPTRGFRAKLRFFNAGGAPIAGTATVETWCLNSTGTDNTWALAGSMLLVPSQRFIIQDDIDDAIVRFRLRSISTGVADTIQVWAEEAS